MPKLSAAVIGLGKIGMGYDYDCHDFSRVLTHASGFAENPHFDLVGGVDSDPVARERFRKKFHKPAFTTISELYRYFTPQVISIAVPTPLHYEIFMDTVRRKPKAVLCEKPLAENLKDAKTMVRLAAEKSLLLLVNFFRRFDPGILKLRKKLSQNEFGRIYKGVAWYSKGILNNGSHLIDILAFLLGRPNKVELIRTGRIFDEKDPEPDFSVKFGEAEVFFFSAKEEFFSKNEFELIATNGTIRYIGWENRILTKKPKKSSIFKGYRFLESAGNEIQCDHPRYQKHVVASLFRALTKNSVPASSGETALESLAVVEKIIKCCEV